MLNPKGKGKKFTLPIIKHKFNFNSIFSKDNIKEENELIYKRLTKSKSVIQVNVHNKDFKKYSELCRKYSDKKLNVTKNVLKESFKGNPILNDIFGNYSSRSSKEYLNQNYLNSSKITNKK